MPKKPPLKTLRQVIDFISAALCGGCSIDEAADVFEREGFLMDVPLPKKDVAIVDLCKQIVAIAEKNPRAGKYYARLVAACQQAVEVDKKIEEA